VEELLWQAVVSVEEEGGIGHQLEEDLVTATGSPKETAVACPQRGNKLADGLVRAEFVQKALRRGHWHMHAAGLDRRKAKLALAGANV
jgi:hypothetical protein